VIIEGSFGRAHLPYVFIFDEMPWRNAPPQVSFIKNGWIVAVLAIPHVLSSEISL
jgi:hypothetical protein